MKRTESDKSIEFVTEIVPDRKDEKKPWFSILRIALIVFLVIYFFLTAINSFR